MNVVPTGSSSRPEVWFLTSELEAERAGSFRQQRWCEVFLDLGVEVVIYNVPEGGPFRLTDARFRTREDLVKFRQRALARFKPMASIREGFWARLLRQIKHVLLVDLYFPNILALILRVHSHLRGKQRPVVIFASSPPFSLALAGAILKSIHSKRVVLAVDMRDYWAWHKSLGGSRRLKKMIECWVLRRADRVSVVSLGAKDRFERVHAVVARTVFNVATHYFNSPRKEDLDWHALHPRIDPSCVKIVYTGSTPVNYYDLGSLAEAIIDFREKQRSRSSRIQFIFVGACWEMQRELERRGGAGDRVVFIPHVPHAVARSIQQHADVLLFLTYLDQGSVSTKIFEYMVLQKPILPISAPAGDDADRLLRTYCQTGLNLHTAKEIFEVLIRVADPGGTLHLPRCAEVEGLHQLVEDYRGYAKELLELAAPC